MLNELAKEYAPKGLRLIGVNSDQDGDLILMRRFIARYKPVFRITGRSQESQKKRQNLTRRYCPIGEASSRRHFSMTKTAG